MMEARNYTTYCWLMISSFALLVLLICTTIGLAQRVSAEGDSITVLITGPAQPPGFSPALLTIHVYDTIIFVNQSSPATPYAVAADDGSFSSPAIAPGNQWTTTFNSVGAHEYHASSSQQFMAGEILVVANSVALLPTPIPAAVATVMAAIQAGKNPPDTIVLATPTPSRKKATTATGSSFPFVLLILAILLVISIIGGLFLYRRRRSHETDETEVTTGDLEVAPRKQRQRKPPVPEIVAQKKVRRFALPGFLRGDEDEDDGEDEDDDE